LLLQGTIIVILGVIGIVAFGSINSGLATETDVAHLTDLWRRGGWLAYFFVMTFALLLLLLCTYQLDAVLISRADISAVPFAGYNLSNENSNGKNRRGFVLDTIAAIRRTWRMTMAKLGQCLELWTAAKDDKTIAWTLGIGWACAGGGLAGGTLVFAKATVKLLSGSLSHENPGNQFGHAASIFTIILLASTAILQIICLNRGLKVYDSTLVVPVFYGVYTATGYVVLLAALVFCGCSSFAVIVTRFLNSLASLRFQFFFKY
jgi:magnesium transporter